MTEEELNFLQEKLSKRTKKRARLRRQSQRLNTQKEEETVKEHNLSVQIDNWMREMQERVERVKRVSVSGLHNINFKFLIYKDIKIIYIYIL